eukprot:UN07430
MSSKKPQAGDDVSTGAGGGGQNEILVNNLPVYFAETSAVCEALGVDPITGLTASQVLEHRAKYGSNALPVKDNNPWYLVLWRNIFNPITAILAVAFTICCIFQEWIDATSLFLIIALNSSIGFVSEMQSKAALDDFKTMSKATVTVIRDNCLTPIAIDDVV